jgi:1-deoxy-D-xylulose-5-phosphate reductoisomerase
MKRIVILGSTGSIGRATIEILEQSRGEFEVVGLAGGDNVEELERQLVLFPSARFALRDAASLARLVAGNHQLARRAVGHGSEGLMNLILDTGPELVVNALVGIAGLVPTVVALENGCTVALANKEALVTGGQLIDGILAGGRGLIIPIDSEHFSISRCLAGFREETVEIVLTASGGPFYGREFDELHGVTAAEALAHPTWKMGRKVSVDSANLLNKGLEVIEAHWLFRFPYDAIKVVIHPQSIVHSIVRLRDGSLLAHLGPADMRLPLMSALHYPAMKEFPWSTLALEDLGRLDFVPLDRASYPAFSLALGAAETGGTAPASLNAADELAVEAFLAGRIGFNTIVSWIDEALSAHTVRAARQVTDILDADRSTRAFLARSHPEASTS